MSVLSAIMGKTPQPVVPQVRPAPSRSDAEIEAERQKALKAVAGQRGRSDTLLTGSTGTDAAGLQRRTLLAA